MKSGRYTWASPWRFFLNLRKIFQFNIQIRENLFRHVSGIKGINQFFLIKSCPQNRPNRPQAGLNPQYIRRDGVRVRCPGGESRSAADGPERSGARRDRRPFTGTPKKTMNLCSRPPKGLPELVVVGLFEHKFTV